MVGNFLQNTRFPSSLRPNCQPSPRRRSITSNSAVGMRLTLCVLALVSSLCWQANSTSAQTAHATVRQAVHSAGKIPERGRQFAQEQVRQASSVVDDSMVDGHYEATLAPAASHYDPIDMSNGAGCCDGCGAFSDACCCHPFGWLLDWSRGDLWLGTTSFSGAGNFLGCLNQLCLAVVTAGISTCYTWIRRVRHHNGGFER